MALQTGASIGREGRVVCAQSPVSLIGLFTVTAALKRLLKDSGCDFDVIDAKTVAIVRAAKPPPLFRPTSPQIAPTSDVVVTATRRSELIDRSPYDVTRLGGDELRSSRIEDAGDLAPFVAGMTVTNLGAGRDKILLRGLSDGVFTGRTQSTVGLYLDDAPLTYNAPDPDLRLLDVAGVEVLRGPQGALYGAGSIGGVVHIITNKPDLNHYSAALDVTGSTTEGGAPSSVVEGVVNAPLIGDRLGVRVAAYKEADGGYIDDVALHRNDVNSATRTGARGQALWIIDPRWSVTLGGVYQSITAKDTQYATAGLGPYQRDNLVQEPHDNDFNETSLVIEGGGPGWRLKSSTSRVRHQIDSRYDASLALDDFLAGAAGSAAFDEADRKSLLSEEITVASSGAGSFQWLSGLYALDSQELSQSKLTDLPSGGSPTSLYAENRSDHTTELAAYGEVTFAPLQKVSVTLGGRLFQSRVSTTSTVTALNGAQRINAKVGNRGLAPKIVVRYDLARHAIAYVQATEGYRGGGVNTSGLPGQTFSVGGSGAEPFRRYGGDELWNYEVGAKVLLLGERLRLRADLFYDAWRNIQTDQLLPSGLPFTANVGDGSNQGLEVEAVYQPLAGLSVRADAVLNDPELVHRNPAFPTNTDARLPGIARTTYGGDARYERRLSGFISGFLNAQAAYVGRSTLSFDPATSAVMGGYWTSKLSGGVERRGWRLELFVNNPANEVGDTFAFGDPFSIRRVRQSTPLRPRTVGLTVGASF